MGQAGTIRRLFIAAFMGGGICFIAAGVYDTYLLKAEQDAVEAGRIQQAAELAGRVRLLKQALALKLRHQIPGVAASDRRFPRELPLIEALLALGDDPAMAARRASLRVLEAGPESLDLSSAEVALGAAVGPPPAPRAGGVPRVMPPPGQAEPFLVAEDAETALKGKHRPVPPPTIWGAPYVLTRRNVGGAVIPLGEGRAGPLGASWDVSTDGRVAVVAKPDEGVLERWDLPASHVTLLSPQATPGYVAIQPQPGDEPQRAEALAYSAPASPRVREGRSEVLYVLRGVANTRVFPPAGTRAGALGFGWAPDGRSLLVRWTDRAQPLPGDPLHLSWLAEDGRELMTALLADPRVPLPARWVPGPGAHVGLVTSGAAWAWDGRMRSAELLPGIRGAWGFSPDGRLVAGLDVGHVFVAATDAPTRRVDHAIDGLPPFFVLQPDGFAWTAEGLKFKGRAADREGGPWRMATVTVRLAAHD